MSFTGTFKPGRRPTTPPPHRLSAEDTADACRSALLGFLRGVSVGWGKRKLAHWLAHVYAPIAMIAPKAGSLGKGPPAAAVDARQVEELLLESREALVDFMLSLSDAARGRAFAEGMAESGLVAEVLDADDKPFWVPLDRPGMSLVDRLLSLVAADYLARPGDYEKKLAVCNRCDAVLFDRRVRDFRKCLRCARSTTARQSAQ